MPSGKTEDFRLNKIITFVYSTIMDFPDNEFEIKTVVTKAIFSNFRDLIYGGDVIHSLPKKWLAMHKISLIKR